MFASTSQDGLHRGLTTSGNFQGLKLVPVDLCLLAPALIQRPSKSGETVESGHFTEQEVSLRKRSGYAKAKTTSLFRLRHHRQRQ